VHKFNMFSPHLVSVINKRDESISHQEEVVANGRSFNFIKQIQVKNIYFSYNDNDYILNDLNFTINKGEFVGLVGLSGVGKTTVVDLILRLLNSQKGTILLDGYNASEINLEEWRNNIGYVAQDMFLINDTIENNIKFYDDRISKSDIIEAAKMANIYNFISHLPEKFKTVVGERGTKLSGGQRQRINLARVLAHQPQFLILDEATSALDSESEKAIQEAIQNLKGKVTVLMIAHRLTTILNSDKVLVLDSGNIIEEGSPNQLLKNKNSFFYKMYHLGR